MLTADGAVQLWHVYVFALLLGCVTAFDAPARQTFVAELVSDAMLSNAVALNSTSFNAARMIGPALAGLLIAAIGTGWVFLLNVASFGAVSLRSLALRVERAPSHGARRAQARRPARGFRLRAGRPDLLDRARDAVPDRDVRHQLPGVRLGDGGEGVPRRLGGFGLLSSMLPIGSVTGALFAARREKPRAMCCWRAPPSGVGLAPPR